MTSAKQRKQVAYLKQMMDATVRLGLYDDELEEVERRFAGLMPRSQPEEGELYAGSNELGSVSSHERHDRRSLALNVQAVRVLQEQPELARRVLGVLDRWETLADPHSKSLRDEWRRIVVGRRWGLAIEDSERGRQLRQASPLGFVLENSVRDAIFQTFRPRGK